ncbi:hypothetical protein N658DRAFT_543998 [Parathielavia hyrcaniae]|uniref:Uncharacterized protein n=1 Tax=Parathielavia hyrcaniae TaxID=113614 RepID=A0AAN6PV53_9PEZI|nr:hypothetical protein N658DRAFT_543998 [Parathielavia hyrcaniae]
MNNEALPDTSTPLTFESLAAKTGHSDEPKLLTNHSVSRTHGRLARRRALTFFSSGFKAELENECCRSGVDLRADCLIHFYDWNNTVRAYGSVARGEFKADPDIAGLGVFLSLIPALCRCCVGSAVSCTRDVLKTELSRRRATQARAGSYSPKPIFKCLSRWRGFVGFFSESLLFIVADAQLVTAFAYGINFGKSGKCTVSSYHYSVMVNTLVTALACLTLSVYLPRHYWRTRLPSFLRTLATLVVFIFLLRFLAYQVDQESSPELMLVYRSDRTDSSLFLPVACFLDPDLDPFKRLSPAQSNGIGGTGTK